MLVFIFFEQLCLPPFCLQFPREVCCKSNMAIRWINQKLCLPLWTDISERGKDIFTPSLIERSLLGHSYWTYGVTCNCGAAQTITTGSTWNIIAPFWIKIIPFRMLWRCKKNETLDLCYSYCIRTKPKTLCNSICCDSTSHDYIIRAEGNIHGRQWWWY